MAQTDQTCSRCDEPIEKPLQLNADYVSSDDFAEPEKVEVVYGMYHTEDTRKELDRLDGELSERDRQAIAAEIARPGAPETITVSNGTVVVEDESGGEVETGDTREVKFSVPVEDFDHQEVESANEVQDDDDLALTYRAVEEREVQKTGLVCPNCTKDDDEIIWGVSQ